MTSDTFVKKLFYKYFVFGLVTFLWIFFLGLNLISMVIRSIDDELFVSVLRFRNKFKTKL